jgi:hypothetical protein
MSVRFLRGLGFQYSGIFVIPPDGHRLTIQQQNLPNEHGVYAFLLHGRQIAYVGHTAESTLRIRVQSYENIRYHQHRKVMRSLRAALAEGHRVSVMTLPLRHSNWRGLEVSRSFSIEQGLIKRFEPAWN